MIFRSSHAAWMLAALLLARALPALADPDLLTCEHPTPSAATDSASGASGVHSLPAWPVDFTQSMGAALRERQQSRPAEPATALAAKVETAFWSQLRFLPRPGFTTIYDPVRDRLVLFGGQTAFAASNQIWELPLSGTLHWQPIEAIGGPGPLCCHSAIYDPVRDRMVVFGGFGDAGLTNEVWALSFSGAPSWSQIAPAGSLPPVRQRHSAIYDPVNDRMVIFGGFHDDPYFSTAYLGDTWALSLSNTPTWTQLLPTVTGPYTRYGHSAIYDPERQRMLLFGGRSYYGFLNDVWALALGDSAAWTSLSTTGTLPAGRFSHDAIYLPADDAMLIYGGNEETLGSVGDAWELSLATLAWQLLTALGSQPPARGQPTGVLDPSRARLLVYGGGDGIARSDLWSLSLGVSPSWTELMSSPPDDLPTPRYSHSSVYDPARDRILSFAGALTYYVAYEYPTGVFNQVDALSMGGIPVWSTLAPGGSAPSARMAQSAIYDPKRDRIVVFGGRAVNWIDADGNNEVWALSLSGTPQWTELSPGGLQPDPRWGHTAVYDAANDRMVVFGGCRTGTAYHDVWALSLADPPQWTEITPALSPLAPRFFHSAIYDAARGRMVIYGGRDPNTSFDDLWALSLDASPTWSALTAGGGSPGARYDHAVCVDSRRDRMLVFGGKHQPGASDATADTWALSLGDSPAWTALNSPTESPTARFAASACYDSLRDQMVVVWGADGHCAEDLQGDVWTLGFDSTVPVELSFVSADASPEHVRMTWARSGSGGFVARVYRRDPASDWTALGQRSADSEGRLMFEDDAVEPGHRYGYRLGILSDGPEYFAGESWVEVPLRPVLALGGARPNPSAGRLSIAFELPSAEPALLEVVDVAGRRVLARAVGALGPGAHQLRLDDGPALAPGVYLVRLTQGRRSLVARACVVR